MAWTYNGSAIREGRRWVDDNEVTHPPSWGSWSDEEKTEKGLVFVDDPPPYDSRFYWSAGVPKAIEDVYEVDENGDPVLDDDGNQVVTLGLKSQWSEKVKVYAGNLLKPTDWYVIRFSETGEAIPADVSKYRASVRAYSNSAEVRIAAVSDFNQLVSLVCGTSEDEAVMAGWPDGIDPTQDSEDV